MSLSLSWSAKAGIPSNQLIMALIQTKTFVITISFIKFKKISETAKR